MTWTRTNGLLSERFSLWHGDKKLYLLCILYYASCISASMVKHRTWSSHIYLPEMDCVVLNEAIKNFGEVDQDDLFWHFIEGRSQIYSDWWNIDRIVSEMTHRDLVQVPSFVSKTWEKPFRKLDITKQRLREMYQKLIQKARPVLKILKFPSDLDKEGTAMCGYLKEFIRGLGRGCPASNMLQMRVSVNCSDN